MQEFGTRMIILNNHSHDFQLLKSIKMDSGTLIIYASWSLIKSKTTYCTWSIHNTHI
jgi:hypothetical protein